MLQKAFAFFQNVGHLVPDAKYADTNRGGPRSLDKKTKRASLQQQSSNASWPSDGDFIVQVLMRKQNSRIIDAVCYTVAGRELYRFSFQPPVTAYGLRMTIQERYPEMLDIALFAGAEHLAPEIIVSELHEPILAKCSMFAPTLWVAKWIYCSKYGLGYVLSDSSIGVYFNDSTTILLLEGSKHFEYFTRRSSKENSERWSYSLDEYPAELESKVTVLQVFSNAMRPGAVPAETDLCVFGESNLSDRKSPQRHVHSSDTLHFVKRWTKDEHSITFQLSNDSVQQSFHDETDLIVSLKTGVVTFVDAERRVFSYPWPHEQLPRAAPSQMIERLRQLECDVGAKCERGARIAKAVRLAKYGESRR